MRPTKLSRISSSKIKELTMQESLLKLNKCAKDEFAVTTRDNRVLHAFISPSLSILFAHEGRKKLRWIRLIESSRQHGPGPKRLTELHFQFRDGRRFILDERDRLFSLNEVMLMEHLYSPCGLWGLVPRLPIVHVLLTPVMVDFIESIAPEEQIEPVIRTFWNDWIHAQSHESDPMSPVKIKGEFGRFKANRINNVMVKFDT